MTHTINETEELKASIEKSKALHAKLQDVLLGQEYNIAMAALAQIMCVVYDDYFGEDANTKDFAMRMAILHQGRRTLMGEGQTKQ